MGYDPDIIIRDLSRILSRQPGRTLASIAQELNVDRHTVTRDLKRTGGVSFRQLQAKFMRAALDRLLASGPLLKKEVASQLGLRSTRALRAWLRRLRDRTQDVPTAPKSFTMRRPRRWTDIGFHSRR